MLRYRQVFSHFTSGVIFFAQFAPPGMNVYLYSALYNGCYLFVQFIISAFIIGVLDRRGLIQRVPASTPRVP